VSSPTNTCLQARITKETIARKPTPLSDSRYVAAALTIVIFTGLALRTYQLTARSVWFDEGFSARLIQFPFPEMLQRIGRDFHPPLYFILLQGWASIFRESAFALRSLSVLFGVLTILGAYLFAVEAFGKNHLSTVSNPDSLARGRAIGLLSAALVAVSAFQIRYSQEVRMYSLAAALAMFSSWALFRALSPPSHLRRWLLFGSLALLMTFSHYYGLFTLAAQLLFIAIILLVRTEWRLTRVLHNRALWHALLTAAFVILGWLPWLPVFLQQSSQMQLVSISRWDVCRLCCNMFTVREHFFDNPPRQVQLLASGVCILVLWLLRRKAGAAEWYILWSAVAPLLFCIALSIPLAMRYFIMAHAFLLVGLAVVVCRIPFRLERAIAVVAVLVIFVGLFLDFQRDLDVAHRPGSRGAAAFLQDHRGPNEPVIVCMPFLYFPLLHYAPNRAGYYLYSDGHPMPRFYGTAALTPENLITEEQMRRQHSRRVWVVNLEESFLGSSWVPVQPQWKEKSRHVFSEVARLGDVIVVEYENSASQ